jgi:hypothetical protein
MEHGHGDKNPERNHAIVSRVITHNLSTYTYQFFCNIDKKHPTLIIIICHVVLASSVAELAVY